MHSSFSKHLSSQTVAFFTLILEICFPPVYSLFTSLHFPKDVTGSIVESIGSTVEVNGIEELAGIVEFTAIVELTGIVEVTVSTVEVIGLVEGTGSSVVVTGADVVCEEHDADSSPTWCSSQVHTPWPVL